MCDFCNSTSPECEFYNETDREPVGNPNDIEVVYEMVSLEDIDYA